MADRLSGKIALVIGAAGGIGKAVALRFADEGAHVIATGTSGKEREVAALRPGQIDPLACDVAQPESVEAAIAAIRARHRRLDVMVNNAGIGSPRKRLHEVTLDEWTRLMDINLRGAFLAMKSVLPLMIESKGGSIINVASASSYRATAMTAPYSASKGGELMLTKAAALEYAADNIRVNAVCPSAVRTPMLDRHTPEFIATLTARSPMGRLATPEDVASLVLYLASDEASYVTGQGYVIDGGRFAA